MRRGLMIAACLSVLLVAQAGTAMAHGPHGGRGGFGGYNGYYRGAPRTNFAFNTGCFPVRAAYPVYRPIYQPVYPVYNYPQFGFNVGGPNFGLYYQR